MLRRLFGSLRLRLLMVLLLSGLPVLALITSMVSQEWRIGFEEAERDAMWLARVAASEHERMIQTTHQLLVLMSRFPQLKSGLHERGAHHAVLEELLKHDPFYSELGIYSPDGHPLYIASLSSLGKPYDQEREGQGGVCSVHNLQSERRAATYHPNFTFRANPLQGQVRKAAAMRKLVLGDMVTRQDSRSPAIILAYPAMSAGEEPQAILTATLNLNWMSRLASISQLNEGSIFLILDRKGQVLFQFPETNPHDDLRVPFDALLGAIEEHHSGTIQVQCPDGQKRSFAFLPLEGPGDDATFFTAVGFPNSLVSEKMDRIMPAGIVALSALLVLAAAWFGSTVALFRPMQALTEATRRLARGDLTVRSGIPDQPGELSQLARAFDEMAETIEIREVQLSESEAKYRMLVEQIPTITYTATLGEALRFTYVSPQLETLLEFSSSDWLADPELWQRQIHPQDHERVLEEVVKARWMRRPYVSEYRIFARSDRMVWLRDEAVPVGDRRGKLLSCQGVMLDITERKRAEESLQSVNQTLRILSECNQALVRASDETSLLHRICQIIVQDGGYVMAWVGYAEQNTEKTVRPMAWAGHTDGYLENADVRWADVPRGRSPIGSAIRTGQVYVTKDILNDPGFGPWRQSALQRGYASAVALPIFDDGRAIGALAIYARTINAFGSEELKVLTELAEDLAYGVSTLRTRDERNRAEACLRESEGRYRAVVEAFDGHVYISSPDHRIEFMNNQLLERTGFDGVGKPCHQVVHGLDSVCPWCVGEYVFRGESVRWECCSPKDNRWYYIVSSPIHHLDGRVSQQAMIIDITDRKEAEEALKESERYFRSILFSMNEDILVVDPNYIIHDANKDYLCTINQNRAQLIGSRCHEILKGYSEPCETHAEECLLRQVLETGEPRTCRKKIIRHDAGPVWVNILFSPLKDEHNRSTHVIEAIRNITTEIELESRLRQAQKMEAIGTLAGGIAHDFNNILSVIIGYTEILLIDTPGGTQDFDNLEQVLMAGHRAKELVNQILAFSRQTEHELRPLRISPIAKEVAKLLRAALPSTIGIRISIKIPPERGDVVLADPTQIHQVLMNLCTNAAHAMREKGGTLEVALSVEEVIPEAFRMSLDLLAISHLKLEVSDTGHGMDQATLERIFEPYFTTKASGQGTGLGMAVVHGIVKSHNGAITVWSEPDKGTRFTVYLPLTDRALQPMQEESSTEEPLGDERILFVDDEPQLAAWGKKVLERLGYTVDTTCSSMEALEAFRSTPYRYALLITDQTMPRLTGLELAREVMSLRSDFPVILCTGFSELITPETIKETGIRDLIMKPLVIRTINRSIRSVLDQARENT